MNQSPTILNPLHEKLDVLVEGNEQAASTIVFVHGFAVDKHETAGYFDDLSLALASEHRIVRFDFSGCGESQGLLEEMTYEKQAKDLEAVLEYVKNTYPGEIHILAQSMGTFVTALLNPLTIEKTVFTGIPNSNTQFIIERITKRFSTRPGAKIDLEGISELPRSSGITQRIGAGFWKSLQNFNPVLTVKEYSQHTNLLIIHPKQDDVVGTLFLEEYASIPTLTAEWMDGDHSFKKLEDREKLIKRVVQFFST